MSRADYTDRRPELGTYGVVANPSSALNHWLVIIRRAARPFSALAKLGSPK